jgi:hypothetical protein
MKRKRNATAHSEHESLVEPSEVQHLTPVATNHQVPRRLCKQEVTGSIPAGSIFLVGKQTRVVDLVGFVSEPVDGAM